MIHDAKDAAASDLCLCFVDHSYSGLWPFHAPRNDVSWLSQGNGLRFGKHGAILSANPFAANELRLTRHAVLRSGLNELSNSSGTVLAFYWPASKVVSFSLRQWRDGLVLELKVTATPPRRASMSRMFPRSQPVVFAISSGEAVRPSMWMARWSGTFQTSN